MPLMTAEHKDAIRVCYAQLVEDMEPINVLDHLVKIMSTDQKEKIQDKYKTRSDQVRVLLDALLLKSDEVFEMFMSALDDSTQGHLANLLRDEIGIYI